MVSHTGHVHTQVIGHEAQDGEDDEAGVDAGGTVSDANNDAVPWGRRGENRFQDEQPASLCPLPSAQSGREET